MHVEVSYGYQAFVKHYPSRHGVTKSNRKCNKINFSNQVLREYMWTCTISHSLRCWTRSSIAACFNV